MKKSKKPILTWAVAAVALLVAAGLYGAGPGNWFAGEEQESRAGSEVRRGPLRISVVQRGNLEAKDSIKLRSEIEGRATILYLIPEGTYAEQGELLAELDASDLEDRVVSQEIIVENARSTLTKAEQVLEIQKSQNASDIAFADQSLEFAQVDLRKYEEGDWPRQLQEAEESIVLAKEEKAQAFNQLEWSQKLEKQGFLESTKLEEHQLAYQRSEIMMEQAQRRKKLLVDFDNPKELARLKAAVEEAMRELDRVKLQAAARLVDYKAEVRNSTARQDLETEKLAKIRDQIQKARLYAPEDGMVVYGRTEGRFGQGDPIQEGTEVRERQEIITMPRKKGMIVEASLHESVLKKVRSGLPCILKMDALPGREFDGTVDFVAHLPDKGSWWANPNQRLYRTEILVDNADAEMRPGMSCSVEIVVAEFDDTLFVPVQAVVFHKGRTMCFLEDGTERVVEVGESSEKWAQILSGLTEGQKVLLSPPAGFVPQAADERDEDPGTAEARARKLREAESNPDAAARRKAAAASGGEGGGAMQAGGAVQAGGSAQDMMKRYQEMTPEQRAEQMKKWEAMTPEQKQEMMKRFQGGGGQGGGMQSPSNDGTGQK